MPSLLEHRPSFFWLYSQIDDRYKYNINILNTRLSTPKYALIRLMLWTLDNEYTYILYIETPRPNTKRHVHVHKCLHCAGIEPATSCVVGEYCHHYAKSTVNALVLRGEGDGDPETFLINYT
jgi:hypothetical protein